MKKTLTVNLIFRSLWQSIRFVIVQAVAVVTLTGIAVGQVSPAQDLLDREVSIEVKDVKLSDVLTELEEKAQVKFEYSPDRLRLNEIVSITATKKKLREVLIELLSPLAIQFTVNDQYQHILLKPVPPKRNDRTENADQKPGTKVTGKVTDLKTNEALPGVSVIVKGTGNGIATNADGTYSLEVNAEDVLVFSFISYKTTELKIGSRIVIDVALEAEVSTLNEVVVNAGYYDVKDKEKTGSISKVTSEVIERQPVTNPLAAIGGRMPGVFIQQTNGMPGGDFRIEIRGRNSLRSSTTMGNVVDGNEPLYIVDDVPFSSQKVSNRDNSGTFLSEGVSPLTSINPSDIESIVILKDADATSIYGSRGANGVVLITTKKGKAGKTRFDLTMYSGVGKVNLVKRLNTRQYLALRREGFVNDGIEPSAIPGDLGYAPDLMIWDTTRYTNWPKKSMGGTAQVYSMQGSLSGGNQFTQFILTVGHRKEGSVLLGDPSYQKGSAHLAVNHLSANKKFFVNISVSGTLDKNDQTSVNPSKMAQMPPNAPALYKDGKLNWENYTWTNPLADFNATYEGKTRSLVANTMLGYELFSGLKIKSSFGINSLGSDELTLTPSTIYSPALGRTSAESLVIDGNGNTFSWIIEPQLTYEKKLFNGQLSLLAGGTFQEQQYERSATYYLGFPSNAILHDFKAASKIIGPYRMASLYRYAAFFGRINYNWNGRYILNLTARRDGSSRFGPGRQFANFGAAGVAWIFSEEPFLKTASWLSFGKLRGSYGITGSDQIGDYQYLDTYSTGTIATSTFYQGIAGLMLTKLYNPDFAWETNRKLEGALELGFINDRLLLNTAYYRNRSSNQLVQYTLPMTTGFTGVLENFPATVQNTGVEIELTAKNIVKSSFSWTTSFNVTVPRNKLLRFPNIEASTYANNYVVGKSIYMRKVFESTGVNPETGYYSFTDYDGDGLITDADQQKPVLIAQDFFGGFSNSFTYKDWRLDIFFQFVKQTGYNYLYGLITTAYEYNPPAYLLQEKRWQKPGDMATIQRVEAVQSPEGYTAVQRFTTRSDAIIGDASFIRLKNISLSYRLPKKWTKSVTANIYVQGQNLLLFTKYKGSDPESQQPASYGVSPMKMLTGGMQVSF